MDSRIRYLSPLTGIVADVESFHLVQGIRQVVDDDFLPDVESIRMFLGQT